MIMQNWWAKRMCSAISYDRPFSSAWEGL